MEDILLLWLGFGLLTIGIVKSVQEEWARQGIGDTSYTALWLWIAGTGCFLGWAVRTAHWEMVVLSVVPTALYVCWIGMKMSSRRRSRHR